jgi:hypothetical protein
MGCCVNKDEFATVPKELSRQQETTKVDEQFFTPPSSPRRSTVTFDCQGDPLDVTVWQDTGRALVTVQSIHMLLCPSERTDRDVLCVSAQNVLVLTVRVPIASTLPVDLMLVATSDCSALAGQLLSNHQLYAWEVKIDEKHYLPEFMSRSFRIYSHEYLVTTVDRCFIFDIDTTVFRAPVGMLVRAAWKWIDKMELTITLFACDANNSKHLVLCGDMTMPSETSEWVSNQKRGNKSMFPLKF